MSPADRPSETRVVGISRFIAVGFCPVHKFVNLSVYSLGEEGYGSGCRLLGPKSCCAQFREFKRWPMTDDAMRKLAAELLGELDD